MPEKQPSNPSLLERIFPFWNRKPLHAEPDLTTRPEWVRGQRPRVDRPFRKRAYHEGMAHNRVPMSYGAHQPLSLD